MSKPERRKDRPPKAGESPNTIKILAGSETDEAKLLARHALRPSLRAAVTTQTFSKQFGELDLTALVDELATQAKAVNTGDLQRPEAMLIAQAHTLDAIFN